MQGNSQNKSYWQLAAENRQISFAQRRSILSWARSVPRPLTSSLAIFCDVPKRGYTFSRRRTIDSASEAVNLWWGLCVCVCMWFVIVAKQRSIRVTHTNTLTGDFFHTSVVIAIVNKVLSVHQVAPFTLSLEAILTDRVNFVAADAANSLQQGRRARGCITWYLDVAVVYSIYAYIQTFFPLYTSSSRKERQGSSLASPSATFTLQSHCSNGRP